MTGGEAWQRLLPFLRHRSAPQRVILYLIADGYIVPQLIAMDVPMLRALDLPVEIAVERDELLEGRTDGPAFVYPSGRPLPHTQFYRIVRLAGQSALRQPMSQEMFRTYVQRGVVPPGQPADRSRPPKRGEA